MSGNNGADTAAAVAEVRRIADGIAVEAGGLNHGHSQSSDVIMVPENCQQAPAKGGDVCGISLQMYPPRIYVGPSRRPVVALQSSLPRAAARSHFSCQE